MQEKKIGGRQGAQGVKEGGGGRAVGLGVGVGVGGGWFLWGGWGVLGGFWGGGVLGWCFWGGGGGGVWCLGWGSANRKSGEKDCPGGDVTEDRCTGNGAAKKSHLGHEGCQKSEAARPGGFSGVCSTALSTPLP